MRKEISFLIGIIFSIIGFNCFHYFSAAKHNKQLVNADFGRAQSLVSELAKLESNKLEAIGHALASGPILRGAIQAQHRPTLDSILEDLRQSNQLASISIYYQGEKISSGNPGLLTAEVKERFLGSEMQVGLSTDLSTELLQKWKDNSRADFTLQKEGKKIVSTHSDDNLIFANDQDLAEAAGANGAIYYWSSMPIGNASHTLQIYLDKNIYRDRMRQDRNGILFFSAIILCLGVALLFLLNKFSSTQDGVIAKDEWQRLLADIEKLKKAKANG